MKMKKTTEFYIDRIGRSLDYICQNLNQHISLDKLAEVACFSPFHFHRIFRGLTGETVADLIRRLRLEYAYHLLTQGHLDVTQTAFEIGYENLESFSRAFKKYFGFNPSHLLAHDIKTGPYNFGNYAVRAEFSPLKLTFEPVIKESPMNVTIKEIKSHPIVYIHHVGPYNEVGNVFKQLLPWAGSRGYIKRDTAIYGFSWDDPSVVPAHQLRYDAAFSINNEKDIKIEPPMKFGTFPGGYWAITRHQGSYTKIGNIFQQMIGSWLPQSPYLIDNERPCLDIYLNSWTNTPEPDLLTDLCIPLQKSSVQDIKSN
ncbi:MAG: AraC family transcriptional regulator [Alphaproteobacteria bacterium]|nr:AraC family transcriptional regulator [Alphaproteobacteria bacterium]